MSSFRVSELTLEKKAIPYMQLVHVHFFSQDSSSLKVNFEIDKSNVVRIGPLRLVQP